jgi:hypothetical protein
VGPRGAGLVVTKENIFALTGNAAHWTCLCLVTLLVAILRS